MNMIIKVIGLLFVTSISIQACQNKDSLADKCTRALVRTFNITTACSGISSEELTCKEIDLNQDGRQEFFRTRMYSDTVLLVDCVVKNGARRFYSTCCTPHSLKSCIATLQQQNIQRGRAIIVGASDDSNNCIPDKSSFFAEHMSVLAYMGLDSTFVPYQMVPGSQDRNRDHLRVFVGRDKMSGYVVSKGRDITFLI